MLQRLILRDFVIVDTLELEFGSGFGTLTGETGAGKSILIDALSLALGERADAAVVRSGAERTDISAEFAVEKKSPLAAWLKENDYADDECLLRRVVDSAGKSRAYINGAPATLTQLKAAAEFLADIHGQHAHHSLLKNEAQRQLLDVHAGLLAQARETSETFRAWQKLREARQRAEHDATASARECELLAFQVDELKALAFDAVQWQDENQEQRRLSHAASLLAGAEGAIEAVDEGENAATTQLDHVLATLHPLAEIDVDLNEPIELIEAARIQLGEAAHALTRYRQRLDLDPTRLSELDARIAAVTTLARKHRVQPEELPDTLVDLDTRLQALQLSADPAALAKQEAEAEAVYMSAAKKLSTGRKKAAAELSKRVTEIMQDLAMGGGRFEIALNVLEQPASFGLEAIEFMVSANPGQALRPLAKVASGGELSRIGLAIQVIASEAGETPTLIFDEVDVGIGGRVAEIVGRLLKQLGSNRQVLCVTHLPQVAAQADWQWSIAKDVKGGETRSRVTPLDDQGRIEEIARMLGGVEITATTRDHAAEMLGLE
ncbi:MAG TPA: DNA repair protein RecN [Rhodocyclaceae bacterium]|jgi:DNA repair protein RecN (Recombination protein N)|nr:DNA repair protein RecN [Rhodocyclaceae bacterium]